LHDFFPDLAYPVIRELTAEQRWRLSQAPVPPGRLGERRTVVYLLPADAWVLLPPGRQAFAPQGTVVVSHGGPTLDTVAALWPDDALLPLFLAMCDGHWASRPVQWGYQQ
jgi:hypothetical protein